MFVICFITLPSVPTVDPVNCRLQLSSEPLYLPSSLSALMPDNLPDKSPCGSYPSPWLLHAKPGQRLNITLLDLSWSKKSSGHSHGIQFCNSFGTVREYGIGPGSSDVTQDICGLSNQRLSAVYTSSGDMVDIVIHNAEAQMFLLIINGDL